MALSLGPDKSGRPRFLNLWLIHLPVTALVSIMHRISGVIGILMLPALVYVAYEIMNYEPRKVLFIEFTLVGLVLWGIASAYVLHLLAGLRHMYHDFWHDHELQSTRRTAYIVVVLWVMWLGFSLIRWLAIE
ncbi:MAG: succinate dehydrogenase, cytochrome b556 subunit [Pseudomonadota bacterium]|nr:succinate dehydrogenase, cytochrome b556 subunit [Pseudomonadota bacterium]